MSNNGSTEHIGLAAKHLAHNVPAHHSASLSNDGFTKHIGLPGDSWLMRQGRASAVSGVSSRQLAKELLAMPLVAGELAYTARTAHCVSALQHPMGYVNCSMGSREISNLFRERCTIIGLVDFTAICRETACANPGL